MTCLNSMSPFIRSGVIPDKSWTFDLGLLIDDCKHGGAQIWPCSCALEFGDAVRDAGSRQRGSAGGISANQGLKIKWQKIELKIISPFGPRPKA